MLMEWPLTRKSIPVSHKLYIIMYDWVHSSQVYNNMHDYVTSFGKTSPNAKKKKN